MKTFAVVLTLSSLLPMHAFGASDDDTSKLQDRLNASNEILHELMATPDKGIPTRIAAKAQCVAIVPGFKKAAFLVGAQYGQGVALCRTETGWSAPVFIQMTGASFGLQAGGQSTDLVLVGVNKRSLDDLLKDKVKLGGDIAIAAGPVGRNSQAATTVLANSEFLTYSRSRGVFAGIDLSGDVVNQNIDDTKAFYGKDIPYQSILKGSSSVPANARPLVSSVTKMFRRHGTSAK
jgi:lipid-binding SYLF domain-containing protein